MKREFLQSLSDALSKEVIDAIMEENGKDIQRAKSDTAKLYEDYDTLKQQAQASLADGQSAAQWKEKYHQAVLQHEKQVFDTLLRSAIEKAGGRNATAITALLDVQALRSAQDPSQAVQQALQALQAEQGYLFGAKPPAFAPGTGTQIRVCDPSPATLAEALKQKFERK